MPVVVVNECPDCLRESGGTQCKRHADEAWTLMLRRIDDAEASTEVGRLRKERDQEVQFKVAALERYGHAQDKFAAAQKRIAELEADKDRLLSTLIKKNPVAALGELLAEAKLQPTLDFSSPEVRAMRRALAEARSALEAASAKLGIGHAVHAEDIIDAALAKLDTLTQITCAPDVFEKSPKVNTSTVTDAYARGFEAAREMAARHIDDADEDLPKHKLAAEVRALPVPHAPDAREGKSLAELLPREVVYPVVKKRSDELQASEDADEPPREGGAKT